MKIQEHIRWGHTLLGIHKIYCQHNVNTQFSSKLSIHVNLWDVTNKASIHLLDTLEGQNLTIDLKNKHHERNVWAVAFLQPFWTRLYPIDSVLSTFAMVCFNISSYICLDGPPTSVTCWRDSEWQCCDGYVSQNTCRWWEVGKNRNVLLLRRYQHWR